MGGKPLPGLAQETANESPVRAPVPRILPIISWLAWTGDGTLGIHQGGKDQTRFRRTLFYTAVGAPAPGPAIRPHLDRFVLRITGNGAYVIGYDGKRANLSFRPTAALNDYLEQIQSHHQEK